MNEIIKVNNDTQTVSARELYHALEVKYDFKRWVDTNFKQFSEGADYFRGHTSVQANRYGGEQEVIDYSVSIDMAKHLCLMSQTEKGKECRQYLIDLEKAWNTPEQIMARALKVADQTINNLTVKIEEMKPKADFFDAVADSKTAISMNEVSKVLDIRGYGRNNLFEFLRDSKILDQRNVPYQRYVDNGWFRVIEQHYMKNGEPVVTTKTLVYQKGVDAIRKMINKQEVAI